VVYLEYIAIGLTDDRTSSGRTFMQYASQLCVDMFKFPEITYRPVPMRVSKQNRQIRETFLPVNEMEIVLVQ